MSFPNTSTPKKPTCKAKYEVEMKPKKYSAAAYVLSPEQEAEFIRLFPITLNRKMMELFGLSHTTLHRFSRKLGLKKKMGIIRKKQAAIAKKVCEKNGYYDSLRGKRPSEQCIAAIRKKRAEGFHPVLALREKNPTKYRKRLQRMSEMRKNLIREERRRYDIGLPPISDLPITIYAGVKYSEEELRIRWGARKRGYVLGSVNPEQGERHYLYYTNQTDRRQRFESNAKKLGFEIKAKPYEEECQGRCND